MPSIKMDRGMLQVLFRYLPYAWIDYYSGRAVAQVVEWDSRHLERINKKRLLKRIEKAVSAFRDLKGITERLSPDDYDVLYPKYIKVKAAPLSFFCRACRRAYSFNSVEKMRSALQGRYRCRACGGRLQQMDIIYACKCGWTGAVAPVPCKKHGFDHIKYIQGNYENRAWLCEKDGSRMKIIKWCPDCKEVVMPRPFRQSDILIPKTLTMIDLIESAEERSLEDHRTPKLVNAGWLGLVERKQLKKIIEQGIENPQEDEDYAAELESKIQMLLEAGIPRPQAEAAAANMVERDNPQVQINSIIGSFDKILHDTDDANYANAVSILEYQTVLSSPQISSLEEAQEKAEILSSSAEPHSFKTAAESFGFSEIYACSGVPIIFCSYGYTRRTAQPSSSVLRGFPPDREQKTSGKRPIYAARLETEGVVFEVDRKRIAEWLVKNSLVDPTLNDLPDNLDNDQLLKAWFLRNVKPGIVHRYNEIDPTEAVTKHVYTLLHSMSHILIKKAAELCGLEKDSLSEYIFPSIPGFLIYCHNVQGFNLGAMFNLFEAFFDKWLQNALDAAENCIYDPICLDEHGACLGCLHLNEISCEHFNRDLDRKYLIGRVEEEGRFWGFWE